MDLIGLYQGDMKIFDGGGSGGSSNVQLIDEVGTSITLRKPIQMVDLVVYGIYPPDHKNGFGHRTTKSERKNLYFTNSYDASGMLDNITYAKNNTIRFFNEEEIGNTYCFSHDNRSIASSVDNAVYLCAKIGDRVYERQILNGYSNGIVITPTSVEDYVYITAKKQNKTTGGFARYLQLERGSVISRFEQFTGDITYRIPLTISNKKFYISSKDSIRRSDESTNDVILKSYKDYDGDMYVSDELNIFKNEIYRRINKSFTETDLSIETVDTTALQSLEFKDGMTITNNEGAYMRAVYIAKK